MKFTENCSILAGAAAPDGAALVTVMNDGLAEERRQHAIPLLYRRGGWIPAGEEKVLPWLTAGIACTEHGSREFVIVGWAGQALVVEDQKSLREAIQRQGDYVSIVRSVATIDDAVYAVGMRRQVYKRIGSGRWEAIDRGVVYHGDETAIGFNAIDGFDSDDLYAVGLNGEIWHKRKDEWRKVHSPTNVHLHSTCCAPSGQVYVGGGSGVFMRGRDDAWEFFDLDTEETIWDLCWFKDRLYMIVGKAIYNWTSESIEKIANDVVENEDFHSFALTSSELLIFGRKKIIKHDGSLWDELNCELPDDIGDRDILGFFNDDVLSAGSAYLEDDE